MEIKNKTSEYLQNLETNLDSILNKEKLVIDPQYIDINDFKENLFQKYSQTNPEHVVKSQIIDEFFSQDGIDYLIKYLKIDKTKNKPVLINQKKFNDPFQPPIKEDVLISEDFFGLGEHRLIFTKFPLFKEQVLLVSRDFKSQYEHLSFENMRDTIILINTLEGCAFFNGGEKSGASQPRKHLQAFPYKSLPNKNNHFGIFKYIKNKDNLEEIKFENNNLEKIISLGTFYQFKKFNEEKIEHIIFKFSDKMSDLMKDNSKANITGEICLKLYEIMSEFLGLFDYEDKNDEKSDKICNDYSFLITQEFIMIARRKEHDIYINEKYKEKNEIINLNSLAFFFIIVSRDPQQIQELKKCNLLKDVYTKL